MRSILSLTEVTAHMHDAPDDQPARAAPGIPRIKLVRGAAIIAGVACFVVLALGTLAIGIDRVASTHSALELTDPAAAVVAMYSGTSPQSLRPLGTGFFVKPGVVVTVARVDRNDGQVFVRLASSDQIFPAKLVTTPFPTDLDVYEVVGADAPTLRFSETGVAAGDSLNLLGAPFFNLEGREAVVTRVAPEDRIFTISLERRLSAMQVGSPVLAADGSVAGIVTNQQLQTFEYLVLPVARMETRLARQVEPGARLREIFFSLLLKQGGQQPGPAMSGEPGIPNDGPGSEDGRAGDDAGLPRRVGASKARILNSPRPVYPVEERASGIQGNVVVRVTLGADATVKSVEVVRGLSEALDAEAIKAAYKLEFEPARNANGRPIDSIISVSINFTIR